MPGLRVASFQCTIFWRAADGWRKRASGPRASRCGCAYEELAVRLAGDEQFEAARKLLEMAGNRCSSKTSVESVARWQQEINHVAKSNTQSQKDLEVAAQKAYWDEIRARYRGAVRTGDREEVSRYKQALNNAGVEP